MAIKGKYKRFADQFHSHGNKARAAREAGYSPAGAAQQAYKLMAIPEIVEYLAELDDLRMRRLEISGDRVLEEIAKIAFQDFTEIVNLIGDDLKVADFKRLSPEQRACIQSAKVDKDGNVDIKLYDKLSALDKLGKHLKLFTDVQEQKHSFTKMGDVTFADEHGEAVPLTFDIGKEPDEPVH
tara:strand:+ start:2535 stop:3080 length:546 start_codon:yes stop_codon:yes gene_type:complete